MEFDYQWKNLPSPALEHNQDRITELVRMVDLPERWFSGKVVLDAGCGSGRYTYALQQLGAEVYSVDISPVAVELTKRVNPNRTFLMDISNQKLWWSGTSHEIGYDLVFSFGVIHHTERPRETFQNLCEMVYPGGYLWLMVYHRDTQEQYRKMRWIFHHLPFQWMRMALVRLRVRKFKDVREREQYLHGWYDALNPRYNHGFTYRQIETWFKQEMFDPVRIKSGNVTIRGRRL